MKKRIMLVDDNTETIAKLNKILSSANSDYEVVGEAYDGVNALEMFDILKPDLMVLDLVMPHMDGFSVLRYAKKGLAKIIVHSALGSESFISKAMELGADYYLVKPVSPECIKDCMDEIFDFKPAKQAKAVRNYELEEKIMRIFVNVGIPVNIKGYQFLREAVKRAVDNPEIIDSLTKKLYPEVAECFDTSSSKVERAMRHALEVAWNRGKIKNLNSIFGMSIYQQNEKPTNGQFIALVADRMLLENAL